MATASRDVTAAQTATEAESEGSEPKKDGLITKKTGQVATSYLEKQIIRLIEYYFGDTNLPRDTYLQDQLKLHDGWIPMEVVLKFNRLSSWTSDPDVIVAALGKASDKLMEISDDKKKIRRSPDRPLPFLSKKRRRQLASRTIYVKGFPAVGTTLNMLEEVFAEYGPIEHITLRSYLDTITNTYRFKGSVFVLFETREKAYVFLNAGEIKYQNIVLIKKWQTVYNDEKRKEREEIKQMQNTQETDDDTLTKGVIIHLSGFNSTTRREDVREHLTELGADLAFIHYDMGDREAWVRLGQYAENSRTELLDKIKETPFLVNGCEITARAVVGDEEVEYLQREEETMERRRHMVKRYKRRARRRGRGGSGGNGGHKRKRSPSGDEPATKQVAMKHSRHI